MTSLSDRAADSPRPAAARFELIELGRAIRRRDPARPSWAEVVFSYPGVGTVLANAIRGYDWFVIQGVVFMVIVTVALTMLIIDLAYPLLDPRINYRRE